MLEKTRISRRDQIAMALYTERALKATVQGGDRQKGPTLVCIDFDYLGDKLGNDWNLVCFVSLAFFPHKLSAVCDLARHYVEELRVTGSNGPYHLCGYCFGAAVATEMALLLIGVGERVGSLTLIEPPYPGSRALQIGLHWAGRLLDWAVRSARGLGLLWSQKNRRVRRAQGELPPAVAAGPVRDSARVLGVMDNAVAQHTFRRYPGRITLLLGRQSPKRFVGTLGWRGIALGGVGVQFVKGDHSGVFNEELVSYFRSRLEA